MPKISVAIPAYNSAAYIRETIESVLAQEGADWELLICHDNSSDGTWDICRSYESRGIRNLRFAGASGQAANWNRCVVESLGDYVVVLHGDDVLAPRYLARASAVLDARPEVGLVHCAVEHIDPESRLLYLQCLHDADIVEPGTALFQRLLLDGCVVNPAGVMVRKRTYGAVGPFTTEVKWCIDWHMWLRIALTCDSAYWSPWRATAST